MAAKSNSGAAENNKLSQNVRSDLQSHSEPQYLPLNPDSQRKIKALISQIRVALQRQQLDAEVYQQLHQLAEDLRLAEGAGPTQTAQRLEKLVKRVERALSIGNLTAEVEEELAELLGLVSVMHDYPNHISELELAVSALLPGAFTAADALPERQILGASARPPAGLKLARKLRNHLRLKTHQHPFPIKALLNASGSSQNRLFSGLSWFLLIFSLLPALAYGGMIISGIGERDTLNKDKKAALAALRQEEQRARFLQGNLDQIETHLTRIDTRNQKLAPVVNAPETAATNTTESWIGYQRLVAENIEENIGEALEDLPNELTAALVNDEGDESTQQTETWLAEQLSSEQDYTTTLAKLLIKLRSLTPGEAEQVVELENPEKTTNYDFATLDQLLNAAAGAVREQQTSIVASREILGKEFVFVEVEEGEGSTSSTSQSSSEVKRGNNRIGTTTTLTLQSLNAEKTDSKSTINRTDLNLFQDFRNLLIRIVKNIEKNVDLSLINSVDLPLMLAVVSAGALGGFVSVIVRADEILKKSEEKHLDLFFVGFFRPVIGMTFAFFLVAMLESGLFSSVFTLGRSAQPGESERRIYFYITISFVAGFSERLVRDFVSQTERQITGGSASHRDSDS